jgi:hypothetical protein
MTTDAPGAIVLGTHIYPARGAAADRMQRALDGWSTLSGVRLVNLQFAGDPSPATHPAFETRAVLQHDSRTAAGVEGARKPIVREMLDRLVAAAEESGSAYAGYSNADILISQAAIDRVARGEHDAVVFSRMDVDAVSGAPMGEFFSGQDTLFVRPRTYRDVRPRLRDYIVGEMPWDVVYTSILLTHARAALVNRGDECRHVFHETIWVDSPFAPHAWRLAHMDWTYFGRWYRYYEEAKRIRAAGRPASEEDAVRDAVFGPLTPVERIKSAYRQVRYGLLPGGASVRG